MKKQSRMYLTGWFIATVLLSLLMLWPMFRQGYWESDDGEWMVIRFSAFHESLRDGHFPVRWTQRLNHGYGYPVFNFLYPLPFYLAEIPHLIGFGFVDSIKIVFGGSVLFAALGMYLFARRWGEIAAFVASILYVFAPYRVFLLYNRGSLGESVALASVPFVFYFADRVGKRVTWQTLIGLGVAFASLIMSHNVIALVFSPILILYLLSQSRVQFPGMRNVFFGLLLGLALAAFFWIPALWDLRYTQAGETVVSQYQRYFLDTMQLIPMLGSVQILSLIFAIWRRKWFFALVAIAAALFIHPVSMPLVSWLPLGKLIQFPWRFATLFSFAAAASAGAVLSNTKAWEEKKKAVGLIAATVAIATVIPRTGQLRFVNRQEGFYTTNDATTTVKDEFTPIWVSESPSEKASEAYQIAATQGTYQVVQEDLRTGKYILQIRLREPAKITFNTHFFPGWRMYVDDQPIEFNPRETSGLLQLSVTPGRDKLRDIKVLFERTPVRKLAEIISMSAFLGVLATLVLKGLPSWDWQARIGILSLVIASGSFGWFVVSNLSTYRQQFDPQRAREAYQNSQWVNPDAGTNVPIGDHGLYNWAGWAYVHGVNPILINPEMPPLGKYAIGAGLVLLNKPALVSTLLVAFAIVTLYFLARELLRDRWLALAAAALFSLEPLFRNLANITMLDGLQIGFLNLSFLFFLKGLSNSKWLLLTSLALGGMASTKFFAAALSVIVTLIIYLVIVRRWKKLRDFILTLPLVGMVHALSYAAFFIQGGSLREYLGAQKWIVNFYRQGNVGTVPWGSYWLLVLFNRWRIWFGQEWGVYTTVKSDLWRLTWPINVISAAIAVYLSLTRRLPSGYAVLLVWLGVYSVFLTLIIGWPHYMLLFLPYSYIILVELGRRLIPGLSRHFQTRFGLP